MDVDVRGVDAAWRATWGTAEPAPYMLRSRFPDASVTFRHVTRPPFFVASDDDEEEASVRYRILLGFLLAESGQEDLIAVTCSWSDGPEPAPRDAAVRRSMPGAVHWRSHDRATEPGYSSWEHRFASAVPPDDPSLRALARSALGDCADGILLLDASARWAVHPDLRSMVVFAREPLLLRRVARAHQRWIREGTP